MAEWQTRKLNSVSESGESIEERVQREKQERWEASDQYAEEQKKKGATNTNIELSNASQVTHEDIAAEKHSKQGDKAALLRSWIAASRCRCCVVGRPLREQGGGQPALRGCLRPAAAPHRQAAAAL
jgi:hypothetical protein